MAWVSGRIGLGGTRLDWLGERERERERERETRRLRGENGGDSRVHELTVDGLTIVSSSGRQEMRSCTHISCCHC